VARIVQVEQPLARPRPNHQPDQSGEQRVRKLVQAARGKKRALVMTHDNPDPDSMASAVGVAHILDSLAGVPTKVAFGGIVGRAENRALVRVLKLPIIPVSRIVFDEFDFIVLVDTQPECGNHSLLPRILPDAVIDHHPARPSSYEVTFADVGGDYGATASIITSYVRAAGIQPTPALATALFYGIKSDTRDLGREFEPIDVENYQWLFPFVDHVALSQIEHPSLPATYFAAMHHALEKARKHDEAVVADLDAVYAPDIVAEVADRLLTLEDTRWSLAIGEYEGQLYLSVRTSDRRMNAGRLVREVVGEEGGSAGGHGSMAGGRIPLPEGGVKEAAQLKAKLIKAFLREFGAPSKGESLV
jgi:nanoRNase/pAp phosphatase (c-di-AMP/oligoRNAs hydrolase)